MAMGNVLPWKLGYVSRRLARVIVLSTFHRQRLIRAGVRPAKIIVKPNLLARSLPDGAGGAAWQLTKGSKYVLYCGRLSEEKGILDFLEAIKGISIPDDWLVVIAGSGPCEPEAIAMARINPSVRVLGNVEAAVALGLIKGAQVTVVPSRWEETFSLVAYQAMSFGVPVIVAKHGQLGAFVEENVCGWTYDSTRVSDLRSAINGSILEEAERLKLRFRCSDIDWSGFHEPRNIEQLIGVYREALSEAKS